MRSPYVSLRQDEARDRADLLRVDGYDVALDLAADEHSFTSLSRIRLTSAGGTAFLDLRPLSLRAITLDGHALPTEALDRGRYPLALPAGEHELTVSATMPFRNDGEGLHAYTDPADGRRYVYGMSFLDAAPTVFGCFDQPDLKAPYTLHVRAPRDWEVIGNAPVAATEESAGARWWHFAETPPLPTYLVTLVAGPYHVVRDRHDGIDLGLSVRRSMAADLDRDAEELFTLTRQCFDEYHRLFGVRYPFGDYHQAFVPEFNAGAMENPGCVTFRDSMVFTSRVTRSSRIQRAVTVAHEMAHQWFGDLVSPTWWDDLWLNESFAEYLGARATAAATEYADVWTDEAYGRRWGLAADQGPNTHPVAGNGAVDAGAALADFDGISYVKGAAILKQLAARLGDRAFFAGLADHFDRHRFGNATMHDLLAAWERASGADLSTFVDQWLRTAGADTLLPDPATGVVRRTPPAAHPAERTHTFRVGGLPDGEPLPVTVTGPSTPVALPAGPLLLDAWQDTWAVVLPDAPTVAALPQVLPEVRDPLVRAGVWNALRNGYAEGTVTPAAVVDVAVASPPLEDSMDAAERTVPARTFPWVLQHVLPLAAAGSTERLRSAVEARLAGAGAGSERQLTAFRALLRLTEDPARVRFWLNRLPDGLGLDRDLRWRLLHRLAVLGATDRAELDAALSDDPGGGAPVDHTRAVAALPDASAKEWAWRRLTGAAAASNHQVAAAGLGLWQHEHGAVVAPYVDRYFGTLPELGEVHSGWLLEEAVGSFFPRTVLDPTVVAAADRLLADDDLDRVVRRKLADLTDVHRRLLAVPGA